MAVTGPVGFFGPPSPSSTLTMPRFIDLHMSSVKIAPEKPIKAPTVVRSEF